MPKHPKPSSKMLLLPSSAGTGKTYRLTHAIKDRVERRHNVPKSEGAINGSNDPFIAAITFTNSAAADLKRRLKQVFQIALADAMNETQGANSQKAAFWRARLSDFDEIVIGTIHTFCDRILRDYSVEADLAPGFSVVSGRDSSAAYDRAYRRAADDLQTRYGQNEFWGRLRHYRERDFDYSAGLPKMISDISRKARIDFELNENLFKDLRASAATDWETIEDDLPDPVKSFCRSFNDQCAGDNGIAKLLIDLLENTVINYIGELGVDVDFDAMLTKTCRLLRVHPAIRKELRARIEAIYLDEAQDTDRVQFEILWMLTCAESDDDGAVYLKPFGGIAPDALRWGGKLTVVGDGKQAIYRFRGAQYEHFDALRDRGLKRQSNIEIDVLDENRRSAPALINFFNAYVGAVFNDEKPVIAKNEAMLALTESPRAFLLELIPALDAQVKTLVHAEPDFDKNGNALEQRLTAAIVKYLISPSNERKNLRKLLRFHNDAFAALDGIIENRVIARAKTNIERQTVKPFDAADIACLVRDWSLGKDMRSILNEAGINAVLIGETGFYSSPEIRSALTPLFALAEPDNPEKLLTLLRSPLFGFSDNFIASLSLDKNDRTELTLNALLSGELKPPATDDALDALSWDAFSRFMPALRDAINGGLPIHEALDDCLSGLRYAAALLAEPLGIDAVANLSALPERLADVEVRVSDLNELVRELNDLIETDEETVKTPTASVADDAVKIMTQHKSKGLEFPVVVSMNAAQAAGRKQSGRLAWLPGGGLTGDGRLAGIAPLSVAGSPDAIRDSEPVWNIDSVDDALGVKLDKNDKDKKTLYNRARREFYKREFGPRSEMTGKLHKSNSIDEFIFSDVDGTERLAAVLDDDRRLQYVSMTRAKELLILSCDCVRSGGYKYNSPDVFTCRRWLEMTEAYAVETMKLKTSADVLGRLTLDADIDADWWRALNDAVVRPEIPQSPPDIRLPGSLAMKTLPAFSVTKIAKEGIAHPALFEPSVIESDDETYAANELGTLFHLLMSDADFSGADSANRTERFCRMARASSYDPSDAEIITVIRRASDVIASGIIPQILGGDVSEWDIQRETPFLHRATAVVVKGKRYDDIVARGVIDVLAIRPPAKNRSQSIHIIDYKFVSTLPHAADEPYHNQLSLYANAIRNLPDNSNRRVEIKATLLYVSRGETGADGILPVSVPIGQ